MRREERMTFKVLTLPIFHEKRCTQARFQGSIVINKGDISQWFIDGSSDAIVRTLTSLSWTKIDIEFQIVY